MRYGSKIVTAPTLEPLTVAEAKAHLRVDAADQDGLISSLIVAARQYAEAFTRRAFITQTWDLFYDSFPNQDEISNTQQIDLPYPPLQSVTSVKYTDLGGVVQTLDPATYIIDADGPGRIALAYLKFWPVFRQVANSIQIRIVAGYGPAASDVPQTIKQAMLLLIGHWFQNREAVGSAGMAEVPMSVKSLLWTERVGL